MSFSKYRVLAEDPYRHLHICGDENGQVFLATDEFVTDTAYEWASESIHVIHVEGDCYNVRLPQKVWYTVEGEQQWRWPNEVDPIHWPGTSVVPIKTCVLTYGNTGGHYRLRAGYCPVEKVWAISGEIRWVSALELELRRNGEVLQNMGLDIPNES